MVVNEGVHHRSVQNGQLRQHQLISAMWERRLLISFQTFPPSQERELMISNVEIPGFQTCDAVCTAALLTQVRSQLVANFNNDSSKRRELL